MKELRNIVLFLSLLFVGLLNALSQSISENLNQYADRYEKFNSDYPQERVYLHFDNTSYYKGEHIWYKANVIRGDNFHATPLSRILYVELVSPIGYPVETQKLIIENGQAHGSFLLKDTLNAGFYEVRAYTSWMLNFTPGVQHGWTKFTNKEYRNRFGKSFQNYLKGNAGIFSRVFPIYESVNKAKYGIKRINQLPKITSDLIENHHDELSIKFYPEGGNLVEGIPTRIAYEAKNVYGRSINVTGAMIQNGDTIGQFKSAYCGRGVLNVIPDSDKLVKGLSLKVSYEGKNYTFKLPKAQEKGFVLNVFTQQNNLITLIQRNKNTSGETIGLLITCRGCVEYVDTINMKGNLKQTKTVATEDLIPGVNIFTIYDINGEILAQREVFVNNHNLKTYNISISNIPYTSIKPFQHFGIDLSVNDSIGKRIRKPETFSVSITDSSYHDESYWNGNILTDLLLSSELKGFIPYPAYYFEKNDAEHRLALDLLMMVQGWTRYDFKQMSSDSLFVPDFKIERNITFSGRIYNANYASDEATIIMYGMKQKIHSDDGYGDTDNWDLLKNEIWLNTEMPLSNKTMRGELQTHDKGFFDYYIPNFYGKRYAYIMMNKKSSVELGMLKAGISGHLLNPNSRIDKSLENKYVIQPLIAYSPLAKPYDYYETTQPDSDIDTEFLNTLVPKTLSKKYLDYDKFKNSYILREVVKKGKRKWIDINKGKPILDVDIQDLMTQMSCVMGRLVTFNMNVFSKFNLSNPIRHFFPEILGLSGHMQMYINGYPLSSEGTLDGAHYRYGHAEYMPKGFEALPMIDQFSHIKIYANMLNRELMYTSGKYHEAIELDIASQLVTPTTVRLNIITDTTRHERVASQFFAGNRIVIQGISYPDEYYSPDYSRMPLPKNKDYRRTVYWNPNVTTDGNGSVHIEFYNNSFSKQFVISAEGITKDGVPIIYQNK